MKIRKDRLARLIRRPKLLQRLGPGLITGAADDDPSGIATYSQAGAAFGLNMLWTIVLIFSGSYSELRGSEPIVNAAGQPIGLRVSVYVPDPGRISLTVRFSHTG